MNSESRKLAPARTNIAAYQKILNPLPPKALEVVLAAFANTAGDVSPDWASISHDVLCPLCEYNLRGLRDARCPECGYRFIWMEVVSPSR